MKILYFSQFMVMTFPPVDFDEELSQGKFSENMMGDGVNAVKSVTVVLRPRAARRKLLNIVTPSSASMHQVLLSVPDGVDASFKACTRYLVCAVGTFNSTELKKAVDLCDPTHVLIDIDALDKPTKQLFFRHAGGVNIQGVMADNIPGYMTEVV
jgi:hypothetical protein